MAKAPKMPFYVDAHLADTQHLSLEEHGAYLLLLFTMWRRNGSIPDNDHDNARVLGVTVRKWRMLKERLRPFLEFYGSGDLAKITQKRLQAEWNKVAEYRNTQSERGKKGARERWSEENQALSDSLRHSRRHSGGDGKGDGRSDGGADGRNDDGKIASQSHKENKQPLLQVPREDSEQVEGRGEPQQAADEPDGPPPVAQQPPGDRPIPDLPPFLDRRSTTQAAPPSRLLQTAAMRRTEGIDL